MASWQQGTPLPSLSKKVTQTQIAAYAKASGDHNPLHLDEAFARTTTFGGTIAHGMLGLAFINQMLAQAFGEAWPASGRLKVRFKAPVYPGDEVSIEGAVARVQADGTGQQVECQVTLKNAKGEEVVTGTATVRL